MTHLSVCYLCLSYLCHVKSFPNIDLQVIKDHSAFFVLLKLGPREMRLYMSMYMRSSNWYNTPSKFMKFRRFRVRYTRRLSNQSDINSMIFED